MSILLTLHNLILQGNDDDPLEIESVYSIYKKLISDTPKDF